MSVPGIAKLDGRPAGTRDTGCRTEEGREHHAAACHRICAPSDCDARSRSARGVGEDEAPVRNSEAVTYLIGADNGNQVGAGRDSRRQTKRCHRSVPFKLELPPVAVSPISKWD